jgi:hypothetical protein
VSMALSPAVGRLMICQLFLACSMSIMYLYCAQDLEISKKVVKCAATHTHTWFRNFDYHSSSFLHQKVKEM